MTSDRGAFPADGGGSRIALACFVPAAIGVLVLLGLGPSGCRPAVQETRRLEFDSESCAGRLLIGWSGWERIPAAEPVTFVWATLRSASLRVDSRGNGPRLVRLRAWPFAYPGSPRQTIEVRVNERPVAHIVMDPGPRVYEVRTGAAVWKPGANEIRFSFGYAEAPRDRIAPSADTRTLAAAFDYLEITRLNERPGGV